MVMILPFPVERIGVEKGMGKKKKDKIDGGGKGWDGRTDIKRRRGGLG
jgi:hypothetical protein